MYRRRRRAREKRTGEKRRGEVRSGQESKAEERRGEERRGKASYNPCARVVDECVLQARTLLVCGVGIGNKPCSSPVTLV